MSQAQSVPELVNRHAKVFARRRKTSREVAEIRLNRLFGIIFGCLRMGESIALTPDSSEKDRNMVILTRAAGNKFVIEIKDSLAEARGWWKKLNRPQSGMYHITRTFAERG